MKCPNSHLISSENSNSFELWSAHSTQAFLLGEGLFMWGKVLKGGGVGSLLFADVRWGTGQQ